MTRTPNENEKEMPVDWVSADIIRQYFNNGQYYQSVLNGKLKTYLKRDSHKDPPPKNHPFCTRSQILYYYTLEGKPVAVVHQYLKPDGTLGGSGLPDPKRLMLPDRIISYKETKDSD